MPFSRNEKNKGKRHSPKKCHLSTKAVQKRVNVEKCGPLNANGEQNVILFPAH